MNGLQELIFLDEIVLQAKIAQRANERLQLTKTNFDNLETWSSIQSILISAGNISKILWPNSKYKRRGEILRQMLKVEKHNPLSNRKFRNHFEHYDERIEEWFLNNKSVSYVDLGMNPSMLSGFPKFSHRGFNAFNDTLVFRGESFDLNEILLSIQEIYNNCKPYTLTK